MQCYPFFNFVLAAQKNIVISRTTLRTFSFYQRILQKCCEMEGAEVRTSWSCVCRDYSLLWQSARVRCHLVSRQKSQLFLPRLLVTPHLTLRRGWTHTAPLLPARSWTIVFYLLQHHLRFTAATHVMDLGRSPTAVNQTGTNHCSVSYRQLSSRRWHTLMIALSQNHKILLSPRVPASLMLVPLPWWQTCRKYIWWKSWQLYSY